MGYLNKIVLTNFLRTNPFDITLVKQTNKQQQQKNQQKTTNQPTKKQKKIKKEHKARACLYRRPLHLIYRLQIKK